MCEQSEVFIPEQRMSQVDTFQIHWWKHHVVAKVGGEIRYRPQLLPDTTLAFCQVRVSAITFQKHVTC